MTKRHLENLVTTAHGRVIDADAAFSLMDRDLAAGLNHGDGRSEQQLFDAYCGLHRAKYGEEFEPNTANPT